MTPPLCTLGYPEEQLREILGSRWDDFSRWFVGQTGGICEGREYDHDKREYRPTNCGPHGYVVYPWDVRNFLGGGRALD